MKRKSNLAPFVDLFSILAIGLLLLMTVTSGTDKPVTAKPSYTIVMLYLEKPKKLEEKYPGVAREKFINIEPYYLFGGKEVAKESLSITTTVNNGPDAITVMIMGNTNDISVGFRVKEIVNKEVLFMEFGTTLIATTNKSQNKGKNEEHTRKTTVGMWIDPVIDL